jgi:hypothetical protein
MHGDWLMPRTDRVLFGVLALWALVTLILSATPGVAEETSPPLSVKWNQGFLAVSARDTVLRDILSEMSRVSGIRVYLESSIAAEERLTIDFDGLTPEEGLRRLLRANNFILVYSSGALAEVRVYTEGRGQFVRLATPAAAPSPRAARARRSGAAQPQAATEAKTEPAPPARAAAAAPDAELVRLRTQALSNPDPSERAAGLDELASSDNIELALGTATRVLETERVSEVLQSALGVLANLDSVPLEPILAFINGERVQDADVRIQALEILTEHGQNDPRVRDVLTRVARSDKNNDVRKTAQDLLDDLPK